ncbi:competence protein ComEC [Mariprofundus micogutta]|uniref:Competence protein ComEC n=1 Tax=Mariprofundus micogutta TaxID=1921010 RepID=A0A1L8CQT8_9PROT|nr:DNA internalization-related competence protein ComEC/Rec2 [Mariprofundus micogutta]GAV21296.1 competence protein ComEC [Mariprofundus micogutta]
MPLLWPVAAWVAGLTLARSDLFSPHYSLLVLLIIACACLYLKKQAAVLLLIMGGLWGAADLMLDARAVAVDESWLSQTMLVTSAVERVERYGAYSRLLVSKVSHSDGSLSNGKALLYMYGKQQFLMRAGQTIEANVSWRLPRNYLNPGSFDYQSWCFDQGIALIGSIRGNVQVLADSQSWLDQLRQRVRLAISAQDSRAAGVLHAILLGDRSQIDTEVNRSFSATGAAHLLAISGMHVGMVASCVFALCWWLLTRREAWIVHLPVRKLALAGGLLAAAAYAVIAGLPIPAQRALFMLSAGVLAWILSSRMQPINTLLTALALILLFDPSALVSLSLWLSFVATAALLLWAGVGREERDDSGWQRLLAALRMLLWISWIATLATLPLIVATFGRIPVYSLPANLLLVPLYGLLVLPLALLAELFAISGLLDVASTLMGLSSLVVEAGISTLQWLVDLPLGELWAVTPPLWLAFLYFAGLMMSGWLLFKGSSQWSAAVMLLALVAYLSFVLSENQINRPTWIVWDVGQGASSALLLPGNRVVVVDAPGRAGSRFNGGTTVAAGLRSLGISHIDTLLLSHAQSDHLGGALSLIQGVNKVTEIWLSDVPSAHDSVAVRLILEEAGKRGISVRWLAKGDTFIGEHYKISILWPPLGFSPANRNNASLVARLELVDKSLLWPGDIERAVERELLDDGIKPVDMMLMPHHGSRTSNHADFIKTLSPALVVAQTGLNNRYGFPDKYVVEAYQAAGAVVKNSSSGTLVLNLAQEDLTGSMSQWNIQRQSRRDMARQWWIEEFKD